MSTGRSGVGKAIVLITDGRHTAGQDPVAEANVIRSHGIEIVSVGIPGINGCLSPIGEAVGTVLRVL